MLSFFVDQFGFEVKVKAEHEVRGNEAETWRRPDQIRRLQEFPDRFIDDIYESSILYICIYYMLRT